MSMNGASLADWQTITEGLNERIQAVHGGALIPVPTSKDHITRAFVSQIASVIGDVLDDFADPDLPLEIVGPSSPLWNGQYQTGNYIAMTRGFTGMDALWDGTTNGHETGQRRIHATLPLFGSVPLRGAELAALGASFLDWFSGALALLTKTAQRFVTEYGEQHRAQFRWDPSTGNIYQNTYTQVGNESTFSDFYAFALAHMTTTGNWTSAECKTEIYNDGTSVWLDVYYSTLPILFGGTSGDYTTPGGIHADLTVYYSSFGDNCGYAVNSSTTHLDYSTISFQNVGPETPITIGFDVSSVSAVPTMPTAGNTYTKEETLQEIHAVWDFSNYFQH